VNKSLIKLLFLKKIKLFPFVKIHYTVYNFWLIVVNYTSIKPIFKTKKFNAKNTHTVTMAIYTAWLGDKFNIYMRLFIKWRPPRPVSLLPFHSTPFLPNTHTQDFKLETGPGQSKKSKCCCAGYFTAITVPQRDTGAEFLPSTG
jgi:hypothetical protein